MKKPPSKVAHNQPRPFYLTVQPRIDFSDYEISGPDICSLICGYRLIFFRKSILFTILPNTLNGNLLKINNLLVWHKRFGTI